MAVRSAMPWPFRWAVLAVVFGFCAAIGLWAFEFGKDIAGLDGASPVALQQARTQLLALRTEAQALKDERDKAKLIANTADTLLTSQKVAQEALAAQVKQLEIDNQRLRDDLGFFEKLIPMTDVSGIAIRGFQAEVLSGRELKWQVLVIQARKNPPDFKGQLELSFTGQQNGKPWTATLPGGAQAFKIQQYGRVEGIFELPPQTVIKGITAKVLDGTVTQAVQTIKL